jgi:CO/xanthine dehydrogenase Mo-binding subunit
MQLITVDYEVLPHVTDVEAAMAPGAPLLHDNLFTEGVKPKPKTPSNVARRHHYGRGDLAKGFKAADVVIEREFRIGASHQGYIEPHACLAHWRPDNTGEMWVCTQGHYMVRNTCAALLGLETSKLRVTASEIGGGFGGKTTVFIEPVALALSRKSGRPVKLVMSRDEVFRASGPTASAHVRVKLGVAKDGSITAGEAELKFQGGAFPGSLVELGAMAAFACYDIRGLSADRHGPDRDAPEERGTGRLQGRVRSHLSAHRSARNAGGGPQPPQLQGAAEARAGPRRGLRVLVQLRWQHVGVDEH